MPYYNIGEIVKKRRKQLGLSQADLAGMTIDISNLSRLERGIQIPQKEKLDVILEKLGLNSNVLYSNLLTAEESNVYSKRQELLNLLFQKKYKEAEALIGELETAYAFQKITNRQFLLYVKAVIISDGSTDKEYVRNTIIDAIKVTIADFSIKYIKDYMLSRQETILINMLAVNYHDVGDVSKAVEILNSVKTSLDATHMNFDDLEKSDILPLILYNLTKYLGEIQRYEEAIDLCDYTIKLFVRHNNVRLLPQVILNKACDTYEIGDKETSKRLFYQAYYCCDAFGYYVERDTIKDQAKKHFGLVIK